MRRIWFLQKKDSVDGFTQALKNTGRQKAPGNGLELASSDKEALFVGEWGC
jgi:hypothetical protein